MFGLVSKKEYQELEEKYRELVETVRDKNCAETARLINENNTLNQMSCVMKQNVALATELQKYKQKYADEVQKRLELAEMVKALEEGAGGNAEGKVDSAAGTAEG